YSPRASATCTSTLSLHDALPIFTTKEWGITREDQDELALQSHLKLAAAYESGFQDDLVVPFLGLERDQNLRPDTTIEKLAKLGRSEEHTSELQSRENLVCRLLLE